MDYYLIINKNHIQQQFFDQLPRYLVIAPLIFSSERDRPPCRCGRRCIRCSYPSESPTVLENAANLRQVGLQACIAYRIYYIVGVVRYPILTVTIHHLDAVDGDFRLDFVGVIFLDLVQCGCFERGGGEPHAQLLSRGEFMVKQKVKKMGDFTLHFRLQVAEPVRSCALRNVPLPVG